MKVTELNGLIKIEADNNKVITTIEPSSLRVKLLYTNKDNLTKYIEVDEEPKIEIPEEPDIDEPDILLNGLTLSEAYYKLLNENRVLKEENKTQSELIDVTMLAMDEIYTMIEPMLNK